MVRSPAAPSSAALLQGSRLRQQLHPSRFSEEEDLELGVEVETGQRCIKGREQAFLAGGCASKSPQAERDRPLRQQDAVETWTQGVKGGEGGAGARL